MTVKWGYGRHRSIIKVLAELSRGLLQTANCCEVNNIAESSNNTGVYNFGDFVNKFFISHRILCKINK
jgi:hypothetical protein